MSPVPATMGPGQRAQHSLKPRREVSRAMRWSALLLAATASGCLAALPAPVPAETSDSDAAARVEPFTLLVDGRPATGLVGIPAGQPLGLAVFCHGYGETVEAWRGHLLAAAERGYLAVAMDYDPWFGLAEGAAWTNAAALHLADGHDVEQVLLLGVSMGSGVSGMALAEAPQRADGSDLYDAWVDVEGLVMLAETWVEAVRFEPAAAQQIEQETGGTPLQVPQEYVRRSPALRPLDIRERVEGVVIVHALNDGRVPYNQGREMAATLRAAAVPTDVYNVLRGDADELGRTATDVLGLPNPLGLAGHAWEGSSTHPVMATALDRLWGLLEGSYTPLAGEFIVDEPGGQP